MYKAEDRRLGNIDILHLPFSVRKFATLWSLIKILSTCLKVILIAKETLAITSYNSVTMCFATIKHIAWHLIGHFLNWYNFSSSKIEESFSFSEKHTTVWLRNTEKFVLWVIFRVRIVGNEGILAGYIVGIVFSFHLNKPLFLHLLLNVFSSYYFMQMTGNKWQANDYVASFFCWQTESICL